MQEERINILILKHLEGACNQEEQAELHRWLEEDEGHRQHYEQVALVVRELQEIPLDRELDSASAWQSVRGRMGKAPQEEAAPVRNLPRSPSVWRTAAALAALTTLGWLLYVWLWQPAAPPLVMEFTVPKGKTRQVALPDGSTVRLNSDSRLVLNAAFGTTERRMQLSGEAYFEVVENAQQPFIVQAGLAFVRVVGTTFNVLARAESSTVEVAVTTGTVQFRTENSEGLTLTGNQAAEFDTQTGTFRELPGADPATLAWLEGRLIFNDTPLSEVFRTLERYYAVRIEDRTGLGGRLLSDTVEKGDPIDSFLERLSITFDITYQKEGDTVVILPRE